MCTGASTPAFTNATAGGTWSVIPGTGTASISAGGVLTGTTAGNVRVRYTLPTGCFVETGTITIFSSPTITTNPTNFTTNNGGGATFTVAASNTPTSYTWQVSTNGGATWTTVTNGGVYSGATTATLTITGATLAMNGYLHHASATNACGTSAYSTAATLTVSNIVLVTGAGTNSVTCGTNAILKDHAGDGNYTNNRNDWSVINAGLGATITLTGTYATENTWDFVRIYDGSGIAGTLLATYTGTGTINYTGNPGQTLTIRFTSDGSNGASGFAVNVSYSGVCFPVCTTPTAQPTALMLFPASTTIAGSFTAASPASDSYLVIRGTSATPPTAPVIGTTYTIGSIYQAGGYVVVDNDTNNVFTATGLTSTTTYYFYIYSFNGLCTGGPLYLGSSPLTGNATTTVISYCEPTTTQNTEYISGVASVGTINDVSNPSGYTAGGYANYSSIVIATQIPGGGINLDINFNPPPGEFQFIKTWVDWNKNAIFEDPAELVYTTGTTATGPTSFGFIIPGAQALGDYRMRIKTRNYGGVASGNSTYTPCSDHDRGETEDYTIRVVADCSAKITGVTNGSACGPTNTVNLSATMSAGSTEIRWYNALTGGALVGTGASWTTPPISATTTYYVTAWNGICETIHRTPVVATILPTSNITVTPSVPEVCGEGNVVQITAAGDFVKEILLTQNFESGMAPFVVTTPTNVGGGVDTPWSVKPSPYQPTSTTVWKPAVNSGPVGTTGNRFAFTTSDYSASNIQTIMTSPVIDATLFNSLTLTFDHYYSDYNGDSGEVQVATNPAGTNWTTAITPSPFNTDLGSASKFTTATVDLTPYAGISTLRFRFVYNGNWADGWAVDNIKIEGVRPLNTTFTWTGGSVNAFVDAGLTTPYTTQSVSTVYVVPTALQLAATSWSFTANATLGNGCPISQLITINNKTKLWKGTVDNNWYNANNWEPVGVPDATTCVFIYDGPFDSNINNTGNDAYARTLTVRPSGLLDIQPNNDLTVTNTVTVDAGGIFNIENSGSLIQVNNVANSGNISMKRNVSIEALDYVYWSSPVANFTSSAISPATPTSVIWKWAPTLASTVNNHGNWLGGSETMVNGKGYIVRSPNGWPTTTATFTANFVGVPNNGIINMPISRGAYDLAGTYNTLVSTTPGTRDDDNWNLVGNPYPSAVDAIDFLTLNTNIAGFINVWTHGTLPTSAIADPFYNNYTYNYTPGDYITYNSSGASAGPGTFGGYIGAGQGFFVLMNHTSASETETVTFNNTMRSSTYDNQQFFRTTDDNNNGRVWLDLIASNGSNVRNLVAYVDGATNNRDRMFDAITDEKLNLNLYSAIGDDLMKIQGRTLPFDQEDKVPMGIKVPQNGNYTIGIGAVDGFFTNDQNIYLEDKENNTIHDLRLNPYSFTANAGNYPNRFVLRYTNETLGGDDLVADEANLWVISSDALSVKSTKNTIQSVRVFDVLGRHLAYYPNVDGYEVPLTTIQKNNAALIIQVTLSNGTVVSKKTIY